MVVIQELTNILQSPSICYWNSLYVAAISFQECKNIKTMDMSWSKINIQQGIGGDPFLFQAFMHLSVGKGETATNAMFGTSNRL